MKLLYLVLTLFISTCFNVKAQTISCQELFETVTENYDTKDNINCFGSTALVKITYYRLENIGFVVAYLKKMIMISRDNPIYFVEFHSSYGVNLKQKD